MQLIMQESCFAFSVALIALIVSQIENIQRFSQSLTSSGISSGELSAVLGRKQQYHKHPGALTGSQDHRNHRITGGILHRIRSSGTESTDRWTVVHTAHRSQSCSHVQITQTEKLTETAGELVMRTESRRCLRTNKRAHVAELES